MQILMLVFSMVVMVRYKLILKMKLEVRCRRMDCTLISLVKDVELVEAVDADGHSI